MTTFRVPRSGLRVPKGRLLFGAATAMACAWGSMSAAPLAGGAAAAREGALRRAADRAAKIDDRFVRTWARYAIALEWSRTDGRQAADLADALESWTAKRDLLSVVMFAWGRQDPAAAARWGVRFKDRTDADLESRNTALHYAVVGMVARDPKLAEEMIWKHLQETGWGGLPRTAPMEAARELAKVDPPAALALADKIKHEGCRVDALRGVLRAWAAKDPQAAGAALAGHKEKEFRKAFPRDLAEGWAHKDPRAAAEYARTIPDRLTKVLALAAVAREQARTDPKAAAELCATLAPLNVGKWHEQMPRVAVVVWEVGQALAKVDPAGAARWAQSLPEGNGGCRREAIDGVAAGWADKDPAAALAFYQAPEEGRRHATNRGTGAAYPAIAGVLAATDAKAALALVAKADRLVLKSHVVHDAAVALSRRDPPAAARVVEDWAGVVDYYGYRAGAAGTVAQRWAQKSPQAAAAWAAKLQPTPDRLAALRAVATAWARTAPAEAQAWADAFVDHQDAAYSLVGLAEGLRPPTTASGEPQ